MKVEVINPIDYPGWDKLLLDSGNSAFFHTSTWAKVLAESYGYKPVYIACIEGSRLTFLMPLMEIVSPFTGRRGVSLPYTDSCPVWITDHTDPEVAIKAATKMGMLAKWRTIEWRGAEKLIGDAVPSENFFTHDLDLAKTEQELFSSFKESNQRNIRKSINNGVTVSLDQSFNAVRDFYRLNCLTRKRHGLPPQPSGFFRNVHELILSRDLGMIITALFEGKAIAASIFFHFGRNAIFKYGASDKRYLEHRPNNLVMWEAIKCCRNRGNVNLNLGRTESGDSGLLQFKRIWGGREGSLQYHKYSFKMQAFIRHPPQKRIFLKSILVKLPVPILRLLGRLLYKHFG